LRHSGAVHLRKLANQNGNISLDAIRQRGGWTNFKMLDYYTRCIGINGNISKNDLILEEDKSRIEKDLVEQKMLLEQTQKELEDFKIREDKRAESEKEMIKNKELAKISCIRCFKLLTKAGGEVSNNYDDYNYMEFLGTEYNYDRHKERGHWFKDLISTSFTFECPHRGCKITYMIDEEELGGVKDEKLKGSK